jgi:hypothetical protein
MLKRLGIEPGEPFRPDERQRRILMCAADTGAAMVANMGFANRFDGRIPTAGGEQSRLANFSAVVGKVYWAVPSFRIAPA